MHLRDMTQHHEHQSLGTTESHTLHNAQHTVTIVSMTGGLPPLLLR